jgi:two-component sensor histidine kinase
MRIRYDKPIVKPHYRIDIPKKSEIRIAAFSKTHYILHSAFTMDTAELDEYITSIARELDLIPYSGRYIVRFPGDSKIRISKNINWPAPMYHDS